MTSVGTSRRAIGNFNGDFDELAALMLRSWAENKEQPLRYTPEFLRSAFEYPGASFELAPAIYRDGRLVAIIAGFPRNVRIAGESKKLLLVSFLTVAPEDKRCGYGALIWGELWKRARALGYDGSINFCVEGDEMNRQMLPLARAFRQPTSRVFSVQYMARFLRGHEAGSIAEGPDCEAPGILLEAASQLCETAPLVRTWTAEEAEWQCVRRAGTVTAAVCFDGRRGMLSGYAIETSGAPPMLCVLLDDILWGDLALEERAALAKAFVEKSAALGAKMVITPVLGYADMQPLASAGFRKTRRLLHTYLTLWEMAVPESLPAMYIDIF
jgi:Myristoyl-CoA:protein N-myristoyltransferase, N-terminal domain